jgi:DNA-binding MarR family transcriptional regulator
MDNLAKGAEIISLFCRLNINRKRELPIRSSEMGLLIYVVKSDEAVTSSQAARFFNVSRPMVTTMVASLERKGYLTRGTREDSRRKFTLLPTDKAANLVDDTYSEYLKAMELLKSEMGEQKYESLLQLLDEANIILLKARD